MSGLEVLNFCRRPAGVVRQKIKFSSPDTLFRALILTAMIVLPGASANAKGTSGAVEVPRVTEAPTIDDFLDMKPSDRIQGRLAKVEGFTQTIPSDGKPSSQRTDVYLGYDQRNLYVVFVAFDSEPKKVRGTMARRENINNNDDWVEVAIDTFNDQRYAYLFDCNSLGVQWDALYQESRGNVLGGGEDQSFDTLWYSEGRITHRGFVVWFALPFKSLRFPNSPSQTWGMHFRRYISRIPELSTWPHISSRVQGRLNQAASVTGLENVAPGRNIQLIPYTNFRSFRALDETDPARPYFRQVSGEFDAGLDAKVVLRNKFVLDGTVYPDFSQVESDDPQVTVNQRFEVYFPEKRPFFMENSTYFKTPINLVFTRRIADPQFGARLTGKSGPYAIGALLMDDQAPGKRVPETDPRHAERAKFGVIRLSRDIFAQSSIGVIYTDREFMGTYNRVGGADANFRLGKNWSTTLQGVASWTRLADGTRLAGPAYTARVSRSGRRLNFNASYDDVGGDFLTLTGFVNRTDYRRIHENLTYRFRPEGKVLIAWGPDFFANGLWDRQGTRLDSALTPSLNIELKGQTNIRLYYSTARERLRPADFSALDENRDFGKNSWGGRVSSSHLEWLYFSLGYVREHAANVVPPRGGQPGLANRTQVDARLNLRPIRPLRIDNNYIFSGLADRATGACVFNNHIARTSWNWQFDRRLSLRVILQYDAVLSNSALTRLAASKNFNADFLISYIINPGTAIFVGYNSNLQNIDLAPYDGGSAVAYGRDRFINDGRQVFFKLSYLIRK